MNLTKIDRQILDSYASMIEGLSMYLGSVYEISLHSLEDYDHSVVKIMNGYHSGRTRIKDQGISSGKDFTSYTAINALGESLKSSTIPILGQNNRVIGVLCINLYLDSPLSEVLESITGPKDVHTEQENFANDMTDAFTASINNARNQVMSNNNIAAVNKNKELIRILHEKGFFYMKNSVPKVAAALGISKNTVYLHLRSIENKEQKEV